MEVVATFSPPSGVVEEKSVSITTSSSPPISPALRPMEDKPLGQLPRAISASFSSPVSRLLHQMEEKTSRRLPRPILRRRVRQGGELDVVLMTDFSSASPDGRVDVATTTICHPTQTRSSRHGCERVETTDVFGEVRGSYG